jgi:hypothetical protein
LRARVCWGGAMVCAMRARARGDGFDFSRVEGFERALTFCFVCFDAQNRRNTSGRMELMKYNPFLRKHTLHRELKK